MSGHQLADLLEQSALACQITRSQVFRKCGFLKCSRDAGMRQDRLDLRAEDEQSSVPDIVERLNSQPVAGAEQNLSILVPQDETEHPAKLFDAAGAVLAICVQNRFGIALGSILAAEFLQF